MWPLIGREPSSSSPASCSPGAATRVVLIGSAGVGRPALRRRSPSSPTRPAARRRLRHAAASARSSARRVGPDVDSHLQRPCARSGPSGGRTSPAWWHRPPVPSARPNVPVAWAGARGLRRHRRHPIAGSPQHQRTTSQMLRKGLIALTSLVAAAAIAAPAQADVVQVINDSVPSMALTNTSTPTTIGGPQMQTNNRFSSQIWTRETSGASGGGFLLRNLASLSQPSVCLRDKPNGLATAGVRLSSCNTAADRDQLEVQRDASAHQRRDRPCAHGAPEQRVLRRPADAVAVERRRQAVVAAPLRPVLLLSHCSSAHPAVPPRVGPPRASATSGRPPFTTSRTTHLS